MGPPAAATVYSGPSELVSEVSDAGRATAVPGPEPSSAEVGRAPVTLGPDQPLVRARGDEEQGPATYADQVPDPKDASSRATEAQVRPESVATSAPTETAPDGQDRDTSSPPQEAPPVVREAVRSSAERSPEYSTATEIRKPERGTAVTEPGLAAGAMESAPPQETPASATTRVPRKPQDERLRGSETTPEAVQGRSADSGAREPAEAPVPAGASDGAREAPARPPVKPLAETADAMATGGPVAQAAEQGSEAIAAASETPGTTEEPARKERGRPSRRRRGGARNRRRTAAAQSTQPNGGEAPEDLPPGKPGASPSAAGGNRGALDNGDRPGPGAEAGGGSPQKPLASVGSHGSEGSGFEGPATARTESAHAGVKDNAAG